jgi:lipid II:glycine glycyltransferase (peptidoglycan interpeptide bridge formation enzyme)
MGDVYLIALQAGIQRIAAQVSKHPAEASLISSLQEFQRLRERYNDATRKVTSARQSKEVCSVQQQLLGFSEALKEVRTQCLSAAACLKSPEAIAILKADDAVALMKRHLAKMDTARARVESELDHLAALGSAVQDLRVVKMQVETICETHGVVIERTEQLALGRQ